MNLQPPRSPKLRRRAPERAFVLLLIACLPKRKAARFSLIRSDEMQVRAQVESGRGGQVGGTRACRLLQVRSLLRVIAAVAAAASASASPPFSEWAAQHDRVYATAAERAFRARIYAANALAIDAHNFAADSSGSWRMGVNSFSDLTADEFKARMTGGYVSPRRGSLRARRSLFAASPDAPPPASVDWTTKGAVTAVKNQGGCGSCWAFSATGAMEAAWFLFNKTLRSFSEQQLIDCSGEGCGGGSFQHAWEFVIKNKGLCSEKSYPYKAKDGK